MNSEIKLGKYKHFKGMTVEVIGIARHSETMEKMAVYTHEGNVKGLTGKTMWVRPLKMFLEKVTREGKTMQRFEFIE